MTVLGWCLFETSIGTCGIAWTADAVATCQLPEEDSEGTAARMRRRHPQVAQSAPPSWVARVIERVRALLDGAHDDMCDVPLDWGEQPAFHRRVWELTRAIPPGRTLTYGEIAKQLGEPGASRAVGQALGLNPYAPIVPCHRVLGAGNSGTGFSANGGVATKLKMLEIERAQLGGQAGLFDSAA